MANLKQMLVISPFRNQYRNSLIISTVSSRKQPCVSVSVILGVISKIVNLIRQMDEKLIEAVRGFPSLWQVSARVYKDLRAKENSWKEVSTKVHKALEYRA